MSWNPFHGAEWPRSIVHPEQYDGGDRPRLSLNVEILEEKEKKAAIKAWCAKLPTLQNVRWLSIWSHVTPPLFEAACEMRNLECFQIKWSNIRSLDSIRNLQKLKYLQIGSSTKVESIEPLAALHSLEILEIENFKLITDFSPFLALKNLNSLAVTGSMWTRQKVGSLEPFAGMTWLKSLAVDTTSVESIQPLANLVNLESLGIGGRLAMEEYARLSAKLPNTQCRWFSPYHDLAGSGIGKCKRCGTESKVMLTGARSKMACKICDATKVERHVQAFNAAKAIPL